jgi:beta-lactamase superfamily II metal-dependent hydrolase
MISDVWRWSCGSLAVACGAVALLAAAPRTLDIYFIDVEGGQATLVVTPRGESLLVDTGFAGQDGTSSSAPGEPAQARDANRILAAARAAGVKRIDVFLITHFHPDHDGGVTELAKLLPIRTFVDHDRPLASVESVKGSLQAFEWYDAVRAKGRHIVVSPGDQLPLKGVTAIVLSSAGKTVSHALPGAGEANTACRSAAVAPQEPNENPRSTGVLLTFGTFRFLDLGDLTGQPLFDLACPRDIVGRVDVYLVAHHGGADAADPGTFGSFLPRVAIVNNGEHKGGAPNLLNMLGQGPGMDWWQLHRAETGENARDERIANLDGTTSYWIRISAREDGSFTLTNARTSDSRSYPRR